jgi:threonine/homoserine/homoserine lactone efflux protein
MEHLWLYAVLVFGIIILPGMDMAFVLASSLTSGRRAGFAAVAGMVAGGFVHTLMSALGIGLLLQLIPAAFNIMLLAGSGYLMWIGYSLCRSNLSFSQVQAQGFTEGEQNIGRIFLHAVLTCLLNPKAYLFMFAVFPQFLRADAGPMWMQALLLFCIGAASQVLVYGAVACAASVMRQKLQQGASANKTSVTLGRIIGVMLIVVACWTVWSGWR